MKHVHKEMDEMTHWDRCQFDRQLSRWLLPHSPAHRFQGTGYCIAVFESTSHHHTSDYTMTTCSTPTNHRSLLDHNHIIVALHSQDKSLCIRVQ